MEGVAALGLACNIVQLVDYGSKLISRVRQYQTERGSLLSYDELEELTESLSIVVDDIQSSQGKIRTSNPSPSEKELILLATSCKSLAKEFTEQLQKLKSPGRNGRWIRLRQALKSVFKDHVIKEYSDRLQSYRSQLNTVLIAVLSSHSSQLVLEIRQLETTYECRNSQQLNVLESMRTEIVGLLRNNNKQQPTSLTAPDSQRDSSSSTTTSDLKDLETFLKKFMEAIPLKRKESQIINSLYFESIESRSSTVVDADCNTFCWILDPKHPAGNDFTEWLTSENSLFWITGKPGSGKSTLMKFLAQSYGVRQRLQTWAGTNRLCVACHYFWTPGNDMQKSQQGLLQTILYDILTQYPGLMPDVLPLRWRSDSNGIIRKWSLNELIAAFDRFQYLEHHAVRFCVFIDGLDEYRGDHFDIIKLISRLVTSNIKICISSRPWNIFEQAYGGLHKRTLKIHEFTKQDISSYIESELLDGGKTLLGNHYPYDQNLKDLVDEINERANGVFLWVYLVIRSLKRGLVNGDSITDLTERLRALPTDLKEYLQVMLNSVEEIYHCESARIFLMCLAAEDPLPITVLSFFDEKDPYFAINKPVSAWDKSKLKGSPLFEKRVRARCPDLIEMVYTEPKTYEPYLYGPDLYGPAAKITPSTKVRFLHRTVYDYLSTEDVYNFLSKRAASFNANGYICQAFLVLWKLLVTCKDYDWIRSPPSFRSTKMIWLETFGAIQYKWWDPIVMEVIRFAPQPATSGDSYSNIILDEIVKVGQLADQFFGETHPNHNGKIVQNLLLEAIHGSRNDFLQRHPTQLKLLMYPILDSSLKLALKRCNSRYVNFPDIIQIILSSEVRLVSGESVLEDFLRHFKLHCFTNSIEGYSDGCARVLIRFLSHPVVSSSRCYLKLCYEIIDVIRFSGSKMASSHMKDVLRQFPQPELENAGAC